MMPATAVDRLKRLVGERYVLAPNELGNSEGTRDNFRQFARGYGDFNPLWSDQDYAKGTRRGELTAPPTWLTTVKIPAYVVRRSLPTSDGFVGLDAEIRWKIDQPVVVGDQISVTAEVTNLEEKQTNTMGSGVIITGTTDYRNQNEVLLARSTASIFMFPPSATASRAEAKQPVIPTPEEDVLTFDDAQKLISRRGASPRYWEDTDIGDDITPLRKPTLNEAQNVQWFIGNHSWILDNPHGMRHMSSQAARETSVPAAFDLGTQRTAWTAQLVNDWMGDDAVLRELSVQFRGLIYVGDTPTLGGKVVNKFVSDEEERLVELSLWVQNQRGERKSNGSALVELPRRDS